MKGGRHILFYVLVAAFCVFCEVSSAQGPIANWSFGDQSFLNFQNHQASAGTYNNFSLSGSAVYSDCNGRFVLHTNATQIKDGNGNVISGGSLFATNSPSECLFVPSPGNNDRVFLFHINKQNVDTFDLYYSVVDYAAGALQVTNANIALDSLIANKLSATMHSNKVDYWLVTYSHSRAAFLSYLVSSTGISTVPVVSVVPSTIPPLVSEIEGALKFSPSGDKLAVAYKGADRVMVCHFDKQTGIVSTTNPLLQLNIMQPVGVSFSVDENYLYYATALYARLFQFDYNYYDATGIQKQVMLDSLFSGEYGDLQLAPDGKLYAAISVSTYLASVEKPSLAYPDCNYIRNDLYLAGHSCFVGLPDFVQNYADITTMIDADTVCLKDTSKLIADHISGYAISYSVNWKDGTIDNYTAPISSNEFAHVYSNEGTYQVNIQINYPCYADSFTVEVKVKALPEFTLGNDTALCEGTSIDINVGGNFEIYEWSDGVNTAENTVEAGETIELKTQNEGCVFSDTLTVRKWPMPQVMIEKVTSLCPDFNIDAMLKASENNNYIWSTGDTTRTIAVDKLGWVTLTCTSDSGCIKSDSLFVDDACPFLIFFPSAITPDDDGLNDYFIPYGDVPANYNLTIYNRWNQPVFSRTVSSEIWPTASTPEGVYSFVFSCSDGLGGMYKSRGVFTVVY